MEPILKLLLQPFQVRTGRGWNSGDKTLPASRCSICCSDGDGMQTRESGGLTGIAEIGEEQRWEKEGKRSKGGRGISRRERWMDRRKF